MTHKRIKRKFLNILFIPDDESPIKKIRLRYSVLTALVVLSVLFSIGVLAAIFTYGQLAEKAYENIRLQQENQQMKQQLARLNDLAKEVNHLKNYGERIQNTLKGYVKISEAGDQEDLQSQEKSKPIQSLVSVFNSIPLKAPLVGFISQGFKSPVHNGVDIVAPKGTPIVAAARGTVLYSDWNEEGGYTLILGHSSGYYTYYKHNLRNVARNGEQVAQGQVIAYLGNSGRKSYGPHLHFEIWRNGKAIDPKIMIMEYN